MNKPQLRLVAVAIVMLLMVPVMAMGQGAAVGTQAPGFSLTAHGGGTVSSADFLGQVWVLFVIGYG